ncbi:hypothetical protein AC578_7792 [Pseudocercospora eumusae]|uniref:Uncharacterized protein n=1 Tax=Pseudocercospora eumusae TaxID=321146 RepID=A0A139GW41_9PEZI|nr:hypothetical protein AC578_7792 [Pseudocercospora eumusae]
MTQGTVSGCQILKALTRLSQHIYRDSWRSLFILAIFDETERSMVRSPISTTRPPRMSGWTYNLQFLALTNVLALAHSVLELLHDLVVQWRSAGNSHLHLSACSTHQLRKLLSHTVQYSQSVVLGKSLEEVLNSVGLVLHVDGLLDLGDDLLLVGNCESRRGQDLLELGVLLECLPEALHGFGDRINGVGFGGGGVLYRLRRRARQEAWSPLLQALPRSVRTSAWQRPGIAELPLGQTELQCDRPAWFRWFRGTNGLRKGGSVCSCRPTEVEEAGVHDWPIGAPPACLPKSQTSRCGRHR